MKNFPFFILTLFCHGHKMRVSTLYHLLKGKRTSSILVYGYFYDLLRYFAVFPQLKRSLFEQSIEQLVKERLLVIDQQQAVITTKGQRFLSYKKVFDLPLNGYLYSSNKTMQFWHILSFAVQVVSFKSHQIKQYIPLENSPYIQSQIKNWLKSAGTKIVAAVYQECYLLLEQLGDPDASWMIERWSGFGQEGRTLAQWAEDQQLSEIEGYLTFMSQLHQWMSAMEQTPQKYQQLYNLMKQLKILGEPRSSLVTMNFYLQGLLPEEIAQQRRLKISTIYDHLIDESFHLPHFPYQSLIALQDQQVLDQYCKQYPNVREWHYREVDVENYMSFRFYQLYQVQQEEK